MVSWHALTNQAFIHPRNRLPPSHLSFSLFLFPTTAPASSPAATAARPGAASARHVTLILYVGCVYLYRVCDICIHTPESLYVCMYVAIAAARPGAASARHVTPISMSVYIFELYTVCLHESMTRVGSHPCIDPHFHQKTRPYLTQNRAAIYPHLSFTYPYKHPPNPNPDRC